jgi:hypothetical protein
MIRFKQEGYKPARTIKLMLNCGEESANEYIGEAYVLVGEPGTGETHLAPTIGVSRISMQDQADVSDTGAGDGMFFMSIVRFSDVALHIKSRVPTPYSGIISVHSRSFRTRTQ